MMLEGSESSAVPVKRAIVTPKAIIFQKYGDEAHYKVEEVPDDSAPSQCPGLAIPQKGPCLYRCTLQLPEISVVSGTFKRKKDAEQSAAEIAIGKLGIHHSTTDPTPEDAPAQLVARLRYIFSDEFPLANHPLSGHFRAALAREGKLHGLVPVSLLAIYDPKLYNLCKLIKPDVESNPLMVILPILREIEKLSGLIATSGDHVWVRRLNPYSAWILESPTVGQIALQDDLHIESIRIPTALDKSVEAVTFHLCSTKYFLDVIAKKIGLEDVASVLISRTVGRASSEMRFFFPAPKSYVLDPSSDPSNEKEIYHFDEPLNLRASYLSGQEVHGDAILASMTYTYKSKDLSCEDVTIRSYYRMLLNKTPSGIYKLSRDAMLVSELPTTFITRTNWKGSYPKDILCMFCRQHRLSEPVISTINTPSEPISEPLGSCKKLKITESNLEEKEIVDGFSFLEDANISEELGCSFRTEVKLQTRNKDLILVFSPKDVYKSESEAIQSVSLILILWLDEYLTNPHATLEKLLHTNTVDLGLQIYLDNFCQEFVLYQCPHDIQSKSNSGSKLVGFGCVNTSYTSPGHGVSNLIIEGPDSGDYPYSGDLSCISYSVSLVTDNGHEEVALEGCDEFEFEIGAGSVISYIEAVVTQLSVGQSAGFRTNLISPDLVLASAMDPASALLLLSSKMCWFKYSIALTRVSEPPEERMEMALFNPPLSKQRVDFAVQHILESSATSLVDFGCGSGSLLDSLLNYETSLERIVGIDISQKSLVRAAKMLHAKLGANSDAAIQPTMKSATLYEGSITAYDSRMLRFDIGTCLEVIEHMEEDQASLFGNVVLRYFRPRILIVSTPNFEYNAIIRGATPTHQPDEKPKPMSRRFRNHDHKFEWTREQFSCWACELASRHKYSVDFSGVGGAADEEPGFASQIAVFKRKATNNGENDLKNFDGEHPYKVIWEWNNSNTATAAC